jgi:hypothetical protein
VGELRYSASVEPEEIVLGESAVVTVQLEGTGNLPLVETPAEWPTCESCELFPPENVDRVVVDDQGIHGSRSWRVTMVPRQAGRLQLGPVELATFDPAGRRYRRQNLGPIELTVAPPPPTPTPVTQQMAVDAPKAVEDRARHRHRGGSGDAWWIPAEGARDRDPDRGLWWYLGRARAVRGPAAAARRGPAGGPALSRWRSRVVDRRRDRPCAELRPRSRRCGAARAVRFAPGRADHSGRSSAWGVCAAAAQAADGVGGVWIQSPFRTALHWRVGKLEVLACQRMISIPSSIAAATRCSRCRSSSSAHS